MATVSNTPSTRDRLLAAAAEVFVEQGYEGARLQDIARAAGLTTGAVYANFRGKDELLFEAIGARADVEMDAMLADARRRDVRELLAALGDRLVQPRPQPPLLIDAIAAARRDAELAGALRHRLDAREGVIVELVEHAKQEHAIDADVDAEVFARFCMTLAMGSLVMRAMHTPAPEPGAWHDLITRLLAALSSEQKP